MGKRASWWFRKIPAGRCPNFFFFFLYFGHLAHEKPPGDLEKKRVNLSIRAPDALALRRTNFALQNRFFAKKVWFGRLAHQFLQKKRQKRAKMGKKGAKKGKKGLKWAKKGTFQKRRKASCWFRRFVRQMPNYFWVFPLFCVSWRTKSLLLI